MQAISYINYPSQKTLRCTPAGLSALIGSRGWLIKVQGGKRFYSGSPDILNKDPKTFYITPVKIYPNADTKKSWILKDNKNKSGVYR